MPKITVLLPVYNSDKYIRESIDSIIFQSFTDWDMLILNEYGSSDACTSIVKEYEQKDSRIKVIQNTKRRFKTMNEKEIMSELNNLTRQKEKWSTSIENVLLILKSTNSKEIKAKSLWLLGEMRLQNSSQIQDHIQIIASFLNATEPKLRERAVNALGRIGRSNYLLVMPYWDNIMDMKNDEVSDRKSVV